MIKPGTKSLRSGAQRSPQRKETKFSARRAGTTTKVTPMQDQYAATGTLKNVTLFRPIALPALPAPDAQVNDIVESDSDMDSLPVVVPDVDDPSTHKLFFDGVSSHESANFVQAQEKLVVLTSLLKKERSRRKALEGRARNAKNNPGDENKLEESEIELVDEEGEDELLALNLIKTVAKLRAENERLVQGERELQERFERARKALEGERARRRGMQTLCERAKVQVRKSERVLSQLADEKQRTELDGHSLTLELKAASDTIHLLEGEIDALQSRLLLQERTSRNTDINFEGGLDLGSEAVAVSPTSEGGGECAKVRPSVSEDVQVAEIKRKMQDKIDALTSSLYATKLELQRETRRLTEERKEMAQHSRDLEDRVAELSTAAKLNEEALNQATLRYNIQLASLNTQRGETDAALSKELLKSRKLHDERDLLKDELNNALEKLEKAKNSSELMETQLLHEVENYRKQEASLSAQLTTLKTKHDVLQHELSATEEKAKLLGNELSEASQNASELTASNSQLQNDLAKKMSALEDQEKALRREKEQNVRMESRLEALQEKFNDSLRQQIAERDKQAKQAAQNAQLQQAMSGSSIETIFAALKADMEKSRAILEERNASLQATVAKLQTDLSASESRASQAESNMRDKESALADAEMRCLTADLQAAAAKDIKVEFESERNSWISKVQSLEEANRTLDTALGKQKLHTAELNKKVESAKTLYKTTCEDMDAKLSNYEALHRAKIDLELQVYKLSAEKEQLNTNFDTLKEQTVALEQNVKETLDEKERLTEALQRANEGLTALQTSLSTENEHRRQAEDETKKCQSSLQAHAKAIGKLKLRLEKQEQGFRDATANLTVERLKYRTADERLQEELRKNTQLSEKFRELEKSLGVAKERLVAADRLKESVTALQTEMAKQRTQMRRTVQHLEEQIEVVGKQLRFETEAKEDALNKLKAVEEEAAQLKSLQHSLHQAELVKGKLEDDLEHLKTCVDVNFVERSELDRLRRQLEKEYRKDLNCKLMQINHYLAVQATGREQALTRQLFHGHDVPLTFQNDLSELPGHQVLDKNDSPPGVKLVNAFPEEHLATGDAEVPKFEERLSDQDKDAVLQQDSLDGRASDLDVLDPVPKAESVLKNTS